MKWLIMNTPIIHIKNAIVGSAYTWSASYLFPLHQYLAELKGAPSTRAVNLPEAPWVAIVFALFIGEPFTIERTTRVQLHWWCQPSSRHCVGDDSLLSGLDE